MLLILMLVSKRFKSALVCIKRGDIAEKLYVHHYHLRSIFEFTREMCAWQHATVSMVQFARERLSWPLSSSSMYGAIEAGNLPLLQYLCDRERISVLADDGTILQYVFERAIACAAEHDRKDVISWIISCMPGKELSTDNAWTAVKITATCGSESLFRWLIEEKTAYLKNASVSRMRKLLQRAAVRGSLPTYRYLVEELDEMPDAVDCKLAAASGNIELFKYLLSLKCPYSDEQRDTIFELHNKTSICTSAAQTGRLKMLQFLRADGWPWDNETTRVAAMNGHLDVLQWCIQQGCPFEITSHLILASLICGHAMIDFLQLRDPVLFRNTVQKNSRFGELDERVFNFIDRADAVQTLKLLQTAGYVPSSRVLEEACYSSRDDALDVVRYLREDVGVDFPDVRGIPKKRVSNTIVPRIILGYMRLPVYEYLRERGCVAKAERELKIKGY